MRRPKPWREWTTVERADAYSGLSLVGLMWLLPLAVIVQFRPMAGADTGNTIIAVTVISLVLCAGTWGLVRPSFLLPKKALTRRQMILSYVYPIASTIVVVAGNREPARVTAFSTAAFVFAWTLATVPGRGAILGVLGIGVFAPIVLTGRPASTLLGLVAAAFCLFATRSSVWLRQTVRDLDAARSAQADLAVAEERLRFSRDVHDVLGRRLSAISLQAELASRMADRGDATAVERMLEVRATAHEALREARELARGYRPVDLGQEIEGARSLLAAAGIELEARLDDLPHPAHEAAAWVVRETLTNVLRHSDATLVVLTWRSPWLVVVNDRPNPAPHDGAGAGLAGLTERLTARGGALESVRDHDYFTVRARLPLDDLQPIGAGTP